MLKTILAILVITAFIACNKASPPKTEPLQKIAVSYTSQPQSTLIHVAIAKGYFTDENLEVQQSIYPFGKPSLQALLDHKTDFAAMAETPIMFSVLNGDKIFVIANIEATTMNNAIIARKDAGINKAHDLKGKRIAYTPGTTSDFFLDSLLTSVGLNRADIKPVPMKPDEMQEAILTKKIDAACTWNFTLALINHQLGANATMIVDREIYTETYNIAAQQEFVKKNPETVKRFLRALIKAENFVHQHPDEAQSIMSVDTKIDIGLIHEVWGGFNFHVVQDQTLLITLEDETRWAIKNKLTDQTIIPDYRQIIHLDSLRAVKPEAILIDK
jgi:NitT/TauT family transport system substrate-binding protein